MRNNHKKLANTNLPFGLGLSEHLTTRYWVAMIDKHLYLVSVSRKQTIKRKTGRKNEKAFVKPASERVFRF
ncbi:hypothetical protein GCM10009114_02260 [Aliiglaciecola litoralis]|uniref:Uncharacterized protein n=1 Tax=Aliiglaciecola litoralis TaxID=582857 RepID=A0ABN1LC79_9ALTE